MGQLNDTTCCMTDGMLMTVWSCHTFSLRQSYTHTQSIQDIAHACLRISFACLCVRSVRLGLRTTFNIAFSRICYNLEPNFDFFGHVDLPIQHLGSFSWVWWYILIAGGVGVTPPGIVTILGGVGVTPPGIVTILCDSRWFIMVWGWCCNTLVRGQCTGYSTQLPFLMTLMTVHIVSLQKWQTVPTNQGALQNTGGMCTIISKWYNFWHNMIQGGSR